MFAPAAAEPATIIIQAPVQSLFDSAVADRRAGRHAAALAGFQAVLDARPADADARLYLGLSLLALGRLDEAESAFEAVLAASPDYVDARLGLAQVAQRRGDTAGARRELDLARAMAPDRADVQGASADEDMPLWRFDFETSRSQLSGNLPNWSSLRLAGTRGLNDRTTAGLAIERTRRFDDTDVYLEGQIDHRWGRSAAYVAIGGAPEADYRPQSALRLGGVVPIGAGVAATLDAGASRYGTGTVRSLQPGLAGVWASERLIVAARWIQVWDEQDRRRSGYAARASFAVTPGTRLTVGYADAPETSEGVTVDVKASSAGIELDLGKRLTGRLALIREERASYDREELAIGFGVRF